MRILVTGSKGQLGSEIKALAKDYPDYQFFHTDIEELNITDKKAIVDFVDKNNITNIINCAAYTAVDKAESETETAYKINHIAVQYISEIARQKNLSLIHISTDYVFDGKGYKPYPTDHKTSPVNAYGSSKLAGEEAMQMANPSNSMIIRTSWVYSSYGNNFVKTMMRLGQEKEELNVICDQIGVPTYAKDLAGFILKRAVQYKTQGVDVFHFTNEGACSWYDFAKEIMTLAEINCKVKPIPTEDYPTPAKRPYYSLMDKSKITKNLNYKIPYWRVSLESCIRKIKTNKA